MPTTTKVLVVGTGSIGERHLRCLQTTNRAQLSFCEVNSELRKRVANQYGIKDAFDDFGKALAENPDAVVICTPAQLHIPLAIEAAQQGIHLLVEKPLSTSLDRVEELLRIVSTKNLVASVAYVYRANPVLEAMRASVQSGRFGEPLHVTVNSGQHFPSFRPAYRDIYYTRRETGGGAIQDALTHLINAVEWMVGPVTDLAAHASHQSLPGVDVEDTVNVIARHGKVLTSYAMNQFQSPNETTIAIACERGTVRFQSHELRWSWQADPEDDWHHEPFDTFERDALFVRQSEHFLDSIEGKRPPACTLGEGLQTLRVNLAVLEAADNRRWIELEKK